MATAAEGIKALEELARHFEVIAEIGAKPGIQVTQVEMNTVGRWAMISALHASRASWGGTASAVAEYIRHYIEEVR